MARSFRDQNPLEKMGGSVGVVLTDQKQAKPKKTIQKQKNGTKNKTESSKPKKMTKPQAPHGDDWLHNPTVAPAPTDDAPFGWIWNKEEKKWRPRKNMAGRPVTKTTPTHTVNVDVPQEIFDKFKIYKNAMGGSITAYVNRLIRDDLEKNEDQYREITDQMIK